MESVYDVDIQKTRNQYFQRKRELWFSFVLFGVVSIMSAIGLFHSVDLQTEKITLRKGYYAKNSAEVFKIKGLSWSNDSIFYGFMFLLSASVFVFSYDRLFRRFFRFHCPNPSPHCKVYIDTWEEWKCPYCPPGRGINDGTKRSFFQKCKCGRRPDAHQCPNCGFVFELIPGGNIYKYSKRPNVNKNPIFPAFPKPPEPVPEPVKVEEPPFIPHGIPFKERFKHALIIASPGWGKTQVMQRLAYYDLQAHSSVIVVDSQGMSRDYQKGKGRFIDNILRLRDKGDLIYIDFTDPVNIPCLSMFDVKLGSDPRERERVLNGTLELYKYVFSSLLGATLTMRQGTMLEMLSRLMIEVRGANLRTLYDAIKNPQVFSRDMQRLQGSARQYFESEFNDRKLKEVKDQVADRIYGIMGNAVLERIFTQSKSKIDLFRAINSGKTIVVNTDVGHLGQENCSMLGRFFIVMLFQAALRRTGEPGTNKPAFLYIDEAWQYFDEKLPELYALARKFDLGLVLASQYIAQFKEKSMLLRNAAFSSAILLGGQVTPAEDQEISKELGLGKEGTTRFLQQEKDENGKPLSAQFYYRLQGRSGTMVKIPFYVMENAPQLSKEEFKEMLEENRQRYCEQIRVRSARQPEGDETVLEPDEQGRLIPTEVNRVESDDGYWHR